jgi:ABC-type branched-subunit amino acid transport system substrate-binding protein
MTARPANARYAALAGFVAGLLVAGATIPLALSDRGGASAGDVLTGGLGPAAGGALPGAPGATLPGAAPGDPLAPGAPGTLPGAGAVPGAGPGSAPGVGQPGSQPGAAPGTGPAGAPGGAPAGQPGAAGSAPLTASDRGVTPKAVKVGFGIVTAGNVDLEEAGFGVEAQRETWQAFVDEANRTGGLNGRVIQPVYRQYDVLNADSMRAACVFWTQEQKVFSVVSTAFFGDPVLCLTKQNRTPYIGNSGDPEPAFQASAGYYFALRGPGGRVLANLADAANGAGLLRGKKIGILSQQGASLAPAVDIGLKPALKQLGYAVTHESRLAQDSSTAQSQIPLAVQDMQRKGVDLVILTADVGRNGNFGNTARGQQYFPTYLASDFAGNISNVAEVLYAGAFDEKLVGFTASRKGEERVGVPEPAADARCRGIVEKARNIKVARGSNEYFSVMDNCAMTLSLFAAGARAAGPNLTRDGFSAAVQRLGDVVLPGMGATSRFVPGKFGGGDHIRQVRYGSGCKCFEVVEKTFRRGRF